MLSPPKASTIGMTRNACIALSVSFPALISTAAAMNRESYRTHRASSASYIEAQFLREGECDAQPKSLPFISATVGIVEHEWSVENYSPVRLKFDETPVSIGWAGLGGRDRNMLW
jgi:hypothetical protein